MDPIIIVITALSAATAISLIAAVISVCSCRRKNTNNETQQERNVEIDIESKIRDDEQYLKIHLKGGIEDTNLLYERNTTNADGNKVAEHLAGTATKCVDIAGVVADSGPKTIAENVIALSEHVSHNPEQATSSDNLISGNHIQETKTEEVKYVLGQSSNDHIETNTVLSSGVVRLIRSMYHEFLQSIIINKINDAEAQAKYKLPSTYYASNYIEDGQSKQGPYNMVPVPINQAKHMISHGSLLTDEMGAQDENNNNFTSTHYVRAGKLHRYSIQQSENPDSPDSITANMQNTHEATYTIGRNNKIPIVPPISIKKMVKHVSTSSSSLFGASSSSNYKRFEESSDAQQDTTSSSKGKEPEEDRIENNTNTELSGAENSKSDED